MRLGVLDSNLPIVVGVGDMVVAVSVIVRNTFIVMVLVDTLLLLSS
jgi:hypothetical protein